MELRELIGFNYIFIVFTKGFDEENEILGIFSTEKKAQFFIEKETKRVNQYLEKNMRTTYYKERLIFSEENLNRQKEFFFKIHPIFMRKFKINEGI